MDVGGSGWISPRSLIDTGATFSVIGPTIAQQIGVSLIPIAVRRNIDGQQWGLGGSGPFLKEVDP